MALGNENLVRVSLLIFNCIVLLLSIAQIVTSAILLKSGDVASSNWVILLLDELSVSYEITAGSVITKITIGVLVVAVILLLVAILGFLGTLFRLTPILILYGIFVIMICGFEIFVIYVWFRMRDEINDNGKSKLTGLLVSYEGNQGRSLTKAWNYLFVWFDCCGVNPQSDIDDFAGTTWNNTNRRSNKIPGHCCKDATADTAATLFGTACTIAPTQENSWINKGCHQAMTDYIKAYSDGFLAISFLILLIGILAVVLGFVYANMLNTMSRRKMKKRSPSVETLPINCGYGPCEVHDVPYPYPEYVWQPRPVPSCPPVQELVPYETQRSVCQKSTSRSRPEPIICKRHQPLKVRHTCGRRQVRCNHNSGCPVHKYQVASRPSYERPMYRPVRRLADPPYWIPYDYNMYPVYDEVYGKKKPVSGYYSDRPRDLPMLTWEPKL